MSLFGFVQAGGGSTRFGADKALVQFEGKTLLARTVELVTSVCGEVKIVAPLGKYGDGSVPILTDQWPGQGPLGGILTALKHLNERLETPARTLAEDRGIGSYALILSCDMPFLTREWLAYLCDRAVKSTAQVIVPQSENGLEPLCACWRTDAASTVQTAFDAGVRKVTEAMKRLRMEVLDESAWKRFDTDGRLFWNMNTPADYEEARRIFEERDGPFGRTQGKQARPIQG
jgi:molybdopterin-guanine dinucleotide biosynthesis protein A